MSTFPWLTVTGAIPLVGTLAIAAIPMTEGIAPADTRARELLAKRLALAFSLATLIISAVIAVRFKPHGP
jgi:NADH-quinone oxidoreductase subunit M